MASANPSTISRDSTQGNAGEELEILLDLANMTGATQQFSLSSSTNASSEQRKSNEAKPPEVPSPQVPSPPSELEVEMHRQRQMLSLRRIVETSRLQNVNGGISSAPFLSGTRLSYQMAAAGNEDVPAPPKDWKPTWLSAFETATQLGIGSPPAATTRVTDAERVAHKLAHDRGTNTWANNNGPRRPETSPNIAPISEIPQCEPQTASSTSKISHMLAHKVQSQSTQELLGNSVQSSLFSFLIHNIEKLEWMNIALNEKLAQATSKTPVDQGTDSKASISSIAPEEVPPEPCVKVMHRVFCFNYGHEHPNAVYADLPKFKEIKDRGSSQPTRKLEGSEKINDVGGYLRARPEISFIVYKSHVCEERQVAFRNPGASWSCSCRACVQEDMRMQDTSIRSGHEQLRIASPLLKKALRGLGKCRMDGFIVDGDPQMAAPYLFLYQHRAAIADKLKEGSSEENKHLRLLKEFLDANYGKEYDEADELFKEGIVCESHLSKLFKPNQIIIHRNPAGDREAHAAHWWPYWKGGQLTIQAWSWKFNGLDLTREPKQLCLTYDTHRSVAITDLAAFPLEYAPKELVETLLNRGKKFWSMRNGYFASYSGMDSLREQSYADSRFMIDVKTHSRMHDNFMGPPEVESSGCSIMDSPEFDTWPKTITASEAIQNETAMLLPNTVPGFEVETKKWVKLNVMQIRPVSWNKKAFNRLVLDDQMKDLIRALVSTQASTKRTNDIIQGKGNGLILLLHGSPGVGKTLTAESVAELAEKPLYRVTCGDIGTEPDAVEKYLRTVLYLGKIWDCVLLMDEADVFLEERTMADLQRNSLVSVFLRMLESYDGILILTSNRVGTFDEAFKSRIQVALHYKPLSPKSRKQIWRNFFDMIEEEGDDIDVGNLESRLDELAAEDMNGRQIRNCLQTAKQLSQFKGEPLNWTNLSLALKTASDFQRYLKNIHGHNDETWAREERLR